MSRTSRPARLQLLMMFCTEVTAPVTMWTSASRRTPDIPSGLPMPSCSSITNCCGSTWITSRSIGIATALAASITRSMSRCETSLSWIAMTPRELKPLMWLPATPAKTPSISMPAISSASSIAFFIASTVESMLTTTPLRIPCEGLEPTATMSRPLSVISPTTARILVVPMSRPTTRLSFLGIATPRGARAVRAGLRPPARARRLLRPRRGRRALAAAASPAGRRPAPAPPAARRPGRRRAGRRTPAPASAAPCRGRRPASAPAAAAAPPRPPAPRARAAGRRRARSPRRPGRRGRCGRSRRAPGSPPGGWPRRARPPRRGPRARAR